MHSESAMVFCKIFEAVCVFFWCAGKGGGALEAMGRVDMTDNEGQRIAAELLIAIATPKRLTLLYCCLQ